MKNYELIEHTADIGIRVKAKDLKELFKNAAFAMFDIIAQQQEPRINRREKIKIEQQADNLEDLFVYWLNELLSLSAAKELIFDDFNIGNLDNKNIKAIARGDDIRNYKVNAEIKAATYHELKLDKTAGGWQAEVIFDV